MVHKLLQLRKHRYITHCVPTRPAGPRPILPTCPRPPGTRQTRPSGIRPPLCPPARPRRPAPPSPPDGLPPDSNRPTRHHDTRPIRWPSTRPCLAPARPFPPCPPAPVRPSGAPGLSAWVLLRPPSPSQKGDLWYRRRKIEIKTDFSAAILTNYLKALKMNTPRLRQKRNDALSTMLSREMTEVACGTSM